MSCATMNYSNLPVEVQEQIELMKSEIEKLSLEKQELRDKNLRLNQFFCNKGNLDEIS